MILGFATTVTVGIFTPTFAKDTLQISLVYPQESNAPKRERKEIDKPVVLKGEVLVNIVGVRPKQLKKPSIYVEYFLDNELIYSTENKEGNKSKSKSLGFTLDTQLYSEGEHTLVVNLWNKDGPSAIGMRKIIIQNQTEK